MKRVMSTIIVTLTFIILFSSQVLAQPIEVTEPIVYPNYTTICNVSASATENQIFASLESWNNANLKIYAVIYQKTGVGYKQLTSYTKSGKGMYIDLIEDITLKSGDKVVFTFYANNESDSMTKYVS